jgi:predicted DNA-binding ribbon-helix-helix protein
MCRVFTSLDPKVYQSETRSVRLNGQCTSIRLEAAFWESIDTIAAEEGFSTPGFLSKLHAEVLEITARCATSRLVCDSSAFSTSTVRGHARLAGHCGRVVTG